MNDQTQNSSQISQEEINRAVWSACDTFRGVMDASIYKDYILTMLFVKYISDVWKIHERKARADYGSDKKKIAQYMKRERFLLPEGHSFDDLYENRKNPDIGSRINKALEAIEDANKEKLSGVFRNIDFNSEANLGDGKEKNRRLTNLLEGFERELDLSPDRVTEDIIGNAYIYLIERFASDAGKKAGEFYTPHKVSELVARLCAPKSGATICDPACGSGGLLIEAAQAVGSDNFSLAGMEINGATWALCRMNMFLHNMDSAQIQRCNALTDPALVKGDKLIKYDNIVANPPFSLKDWGAEEVQDDPYNRFWRGIPPKSKGDFAFVTHMVEVAKEKSGRVAVVVPHGVLFRQASEGRIRRQMIEENLLDAVIGLPGNLFPTTSIAVAILVFDRSREKGGKNEGNTDILFIDASGAGEYEAGKNQNRLLDAHIKKILSAYKNRKNVDKYAYVAAREEIEENDFNLNIPRYVDTFEEEEEIDIFALQEEIEELEAELAGIRKEMSKKLKEIMP